MVDQSLQYPADGTLQSQIHAAFTQHARLYQKKKT